MKFEAPYSYEELILAIDSEQGIMVNKAEFLAHCYSYLDFIDMSVDMRNSRKTALVLLKRYLCDVLSFELSNKFLLEFSFWYKSQHANSLKMHGHKRCVGAVLDLCLVLMSRGILAEIKLYPLKTLKKMERLKSLSSFTRSCIARYEKEGCCLKTQLAFIQTNDGELIQQRNYTRTAKALGKRSIFDRIGRFIYLMETLGKSDIKDVTVEDLERLLNKEGDSKTIRKIFLEVESLFGNMDGLGLLKNNPFGKLKYEKPRSQANHDMLRPEDVEKLFEAAQHIDEMDINEVRILVFMLLSYDTAMRCGEMLLLNTEDVILENDDDVTLLLKGENQKGSHKMNRYILLLFPAVRELLKKYLRDVRPQFQPRSDALFLNRKGERIKANQINVSLKEFANKLGIKTFNGKDLTTHIFRHTFASLNITPLGLRLNLDQIISRLRHKDRALAEKVYILDNPYVEKLKHKERMSLLNDSSHERFWRIPKAVFTGWLKDELQLTGNLISKIEDAHDLYNPEKSVKEKPQLINKKLISEDDTLGLLSDFDLTLNSLRSYCLKNKYCTEFKGTYKYDEEFIWKLRNDYESRESALDKMGISLAHFYRLKNKLELITIGRTPLVKKTAVLSYISQS